MVVVEAVAVVVTRRDVEAKAEAEAEAEVVLAAKQDSDAVAKANEDEGKDVTEGVLHRNRVPGLVERRHSVPPMAVAIADPWIAFWILFTQRLQPKRLLAGAIGDS